LIGPVTNVKENLIGGATISFGYLIDYLKANNESFTLVNTQSYPKGKIKILNPFLVLIKVLVNLFKTDVLFLNCSEEYTERFSEIQKWIFNKTTLKTDLLFLQTKKLMQFYQDKNIKTLQLPTSRDNPKELRADRGFEKRFIYLGFVNKSKGIDHLLEAAKQLEDDYVIHIYGPIRENYEAIEGKTFQEKFAAQKGIYQGVLEKEKVLETIRKYDVLVLPTFYQGEGYPGVIIEAYSLGLPVITTYWKAIPEIVESEKTGFLIKPQSTEALVDAMKFFNLNNYEDFSKSARSHFEKTFSTKRVAGNAIAAVKALF